MELAGIHHLTAISAQIRDNHQFYTKVLGLRLVKRSVNQDDVSAYHLFYSGDRRGAPGNDLTFFDWPVPSERRGTHSISRTGLRVGSTAALDWWADWLPAHGVNHNGIREIDGRPTLYFEDPEGQRFALVSDAGQSEPGGPREPLAAWEKSPVPVEFQIHGQGPIELSVPDLAPTDSLLTTVIGMRKVRQYAHPDQPRETVHVYEMGTGGASAELHVAVQPGLPQARQGAGAVHHVAFRTTMADYDAWLERLRSMRVPNSGPVDRFWFQSIYFREPNGILFEIATDEPGFGIDEELATLGEKVVLPPFLEPDRERIEAGLKPID